MGDSHSFCDGRDAAAAAPPTSLPTECDFAGWGGAAAAQGGLVGELSGGWRMKLAFARAML